MLNLSTSYFLSLLYFIVSSPHSANLMNSLVSRYSSTSYESELRRKQEELEDENFGDSMWGSAAGFGNLSKNGGIPMFNLPSVPDVCVTCSIVAWFTDNETCAPL